jgi:hypothetical protein
MKVINTACAFAIVSVICCLVGIVRIETYTAVPVYPNDHDSIGLGQGFIDAARLSFEGFVSSTVPWITSLVLLIIGVWMHRQSAQRWRMAQITAALLLLALPFPIYLIWAWR